MKFSDLDIFVNNQVKREKYLIGRLGHGIGVNIHQSPSVRGDDILSDNAIFTIEPALYFYDKKYGIKLEDMIMIKENKIIILTNFSKNINKLIIPF